MATRTAQNKEYREHDEYSSQSGLASRSGVGGRRVAFQGATLVEIDSVRGVDDLAYAQLDDLLVAVEGEMGCDVMSVTGPIVPGLDRIIRQAIQAYDKRTESLAVILTTQGGIVEVTERIVDTIRQAYPKDVNFVVLDAAMSAGTVLALSGDNIYMDCFSRLGPIDPQVEREGRLLPALLYLEQYDGMRMKAASGQFTQADAVLLSKLDLAELQSFDQSRALTETLLENWLSQYKFKNWTETETRKIPVDDAMRKGRAKEIAEKLNKRDLWLSHSRFIDMRRLRAELNIKIEDLDTRPNLAKAMQRYFNLLQDVIRRNQFRVFVHTRRFK